MTHPVGIQIGASSEAIAEARTAVLDILSAGKSGRTTRKALDVFAHICEVKNTNITGATVSVGDPYRPAPVTVSS